MHLYVAFLLLRHLRWRNIETYSTLPLRIYTSKEIFELTRSRNRKEEVAFRKIGRKIPVETVLVVGVIYKELEIAQE